MADVSDHKIRPRLSDLALALVFLTRLPWPGALDAGRPVGRVAWAFPLIGAGLGALAGLVWLVVAALALPPLLAAGVVVAALALVTGNLHEDGLADSADGLASGRLGAAAGDHAGQPGGRPWCSGHAVGGWLEVGRGSSVAADFAALIARLGRALMLLPVWIAGPAASDEQRGGLSSRGAVALALAAAVGLLALPAPVFGMAVVSGLVVGWMAGRAAHRWLYGRCFGGRRTIGRNRWRRDLGRGGVLARWSRSDP